MRVSVRGDKGRRFNAVESSKRASRKGINTMAEVTHLVRNCTGPIYREGFLVLEESFVRNYDSKHPISLKGEFIVGIMIVVDCQYGNRVPHSPILLRLENHDVVFAGFDGITPLAWIGAVCNQVPVCVRLEEKPCYPHCLAWSRDRSATAIVGHELCSLTAEATPSNRIIIESDEGVSKAYTF